MRERRQERHDERQDDRNFGRRSSGNNCYQMREKLVSIGDDFWIENDEGQKAYKINGKALRVRQTLIFEDSQGHELCKIQERMLRIKDSMEIEGPNGEKLAMVKKAMITPVRERFTAKIGNGQDLDIQGNILDHEYSIEAGRDKIAEVSKKWFRVRDTYGVEIQPGQNEILILAITVCIDQMAH
jgi:uncharacterized protein YxjI